MEDPKKIIAQLRTHFESYKLEVARLVHYVEKADETIKRKDAEIAELRRQLRVARALRAQEK